MTSFAFWLYLVLLPLTCAVASTPCSVARQIRDANVLNTTEYEKYVPLLVCIAGYHDYTYAYQQKDASGSSYYYRGIFGIYSADLESYSSSANSYYSSTSYLGSQVTYTVKKLLQVKEYQGFYARLCSPSFVKKVTCFVRYRLYTVFDPIKKDILQKLYYTQDDVTVEKLKQLGLEDEEYNSPLSQINPSSTAIPPTGDSIEPIEGTATAFLQPGDGTEAIISSSSQTTGQPPPNIVHHSWNWIGVSIAIFAFWIVGIIAYISMNKLKQYFPNGNGCRSSSQCPPVGLEENLF
ncbi:Hypothetical protein NTJ_02092 [Nesidiocoris tenuis]|uniref:Uncharacterized protein n=1 Tax=Nesidiocoris tenuis TaxID=355587 RepID=A0ABN7AAJ8_9HEMI|nr:Hypothetical protein NTJ_02092 [Nesidiocoris tenuis]